MKHFFRTFFLCMLSMVTLTVSARAAEDILRVGLRWGESALCSAQLQNVRGSGFRLGWFDETDRTFHELARVNEKKLRVSRRGSRAEVASASTGKILFRFDLSDAGLGIQPDGGGEKAVTRFDGETWYGGFEFRPDSGGTISVINVVELEDYVKGVLPYEMSPDWPLEALKAQAVCARTYARLPSRHCEESNFDVCNTTDCQVYRGTGLASDLTDRAVEETAGVAAMYGGKYAETYFCSSNGGASESPENVWSGAVPYLVEKEDPYEGTTDIPDYDYTVTYTYSQLSKLLRDKGYSIGTVCGARVSRTTPAGNALEITIRDTAGRSVKLERQDCRWVLGAKSMRFTISAGASRQSASGGSDVTITGTGWGHGIGMSQYGAKAMAELGKTYEEILDFYFTGITLERVG